MFANLPHTLWPIGRANRNSNKSLPWGWGALVVIALLNSSPVYAVHGKGANTGAAESSTDELSTKMAPDRLVGAGWQRYAAGDLDGAAEVAATLGKTRLAPAGQVLLAAVYYAQKDYDKCLRTVQKVYPISFGAVENAQYAQLLNLQNRIALSEIGKAQYRLSYPGEVVLQNLLEGTKKDLAGVGHHDVEALLIIAEIYKKMEWAGLSLAYKIEAYNVASKLYDDGVFRKDQEGADFLGTIAYEIAASYTAMGYVDDAAPWLQTGFERRQKVSRDGGQGRKKE